MRRASRIQNRKKLINNERPQNYNVVRSSLQGAAQSMPSASFGLSPYVL
jgi:hypothetical protein